MNLPRILKKNFVCAADGCGGLDRLKEAGAVVVSDSFKLPFADGKFDRIIARGVPVCQWGCERSGGPDVLCVTPPTTHLGPVYCVKKVYLKNSSTL